MTDRESYHTLSPELRSLILSANSALSRINRANAGSFTSDTALRQARAAAAELATLAAQIVKRLPTPLDADGNRVVNFRRGG